MGSVFPASSHGLCPHCAPEYEHVHLFWTTIMAILERDKFRYCHFFTSIYIKNVFWGLQQRWKNFKVYPSDHRGTPSFFLPVLLLLKLKCFKISSWFCAGIYIDIAGCRFGGREPLALCPLAVQNCVWKTLQIDQCYVSQCISALSPPPPLLSLCSPDAKPRVLYSSFFAKLQILCINSPGAICPGRQEKIGSIFGAHFCTDKIVLWMSCSWRREGKRGLINLSQKLNRLAHHGVADPWVMDLVPFGAGSGSSFKNFGSWKTEENNFFKEYRYRYLVCYFWVQIHCTENLKDNLL